MFVKYCNCELCSIIIVYILSLWLCPMDSPFCWSWVVRDICIHVSLVIFVIISLQLLYMFIIFACRIVYTLFAYKSTLQSACCVYGFKWCHMYQRGRSDMNIVVFGMVSKTLYWCIWALWRVVQLILAQGESTRTQTVRPHEQWSWKQFEAVLLLLTAISFIVSGWQFVSPKECTALYSNLVWVRICLFKIGKPNLCCFCWSFQDC